MRGPSRARTARHREQTQHCTTELSFSAVARYARTLLSCLAFFFYVERAHALLTVVLALGSRTLIQICKTGLYDGQSYSSRVNVKNSKSYSRIELEVPYLSIQVRWPSQTMETKGKVVKKGGK